MRRDEFEDRMRALEVFHSLRLPPGAWVILRLDGRSFSRFTETHFDKPFDSRFHDLMVRTAQAVQEDLHGLYAYTESDEISVLLPRTWNLFDREKSVFLSAGLASAVFSLACGTPVQFDNRAVLATEDEQVVDYFRWRQADAARCALNGLLDTPQGGADRGPGEIRVGRQECDRQERTALPGRSQLQRVTELARTRDRSVLGELRAGRLSSKARAEGDRHSPARQGGSRTANRGGVRRRHQPPAAAGKTTEARIGHSRRQSHPHHRGALCTALDKIDRLRAGRITRAKAAPPGNSTAALLQPALTATMPCPRCCRLPFAKPTASTCGSKPSGRTRRRSAPLGRHTPPAAGRVMTKASCRWVAAECYVAARAVAPISPVAVRGPDSRLILHESEGRDRIRTPVPFDVPPRGTRVSVQTTAWHRRDSHGGR
jgi:hypothetical protein